MSTHISLYLLLFNVFMLVFSLMTEPKKMKKDRKLGDKWRGWQGGTENTKERGKKLFIMLSFTGILVFLAGLFLTWYMILPRMREFGPVAVHVAGIAIIFLTAVSILWFVLMVLSIASRKNLLVGKKSPVLIARFVDRFLWIGKLLGFNRDEIGNSFVKVNNELVKLNSYKHKVDRLLVLLPRCITPDNRKAAAALSETCSCEMYVAVGGEAAREKILSYRPEAVVAVACERDLVSGIRDAMGSIPILGIANTRPEGPCKNTHFDTDLLRHHIEYFKRPTQNLT